MQILRVVLAGFILSAWLASAQTANDTNASKQPAPGFSINALDKTVDPCVDFYQYACGNWLKNTQIPADQPEWVSFIELDERNKDVLRDILEKASSGGASRTPIDQKIGDFYGACMDEKAADAKGIAPLKPELDKIAAVKDKAALIDAIAHNHMIGAGALFNFYSNSDLHNADQVIAYIDQGGLTLPDRDYYIKDDPKQVEMRKNLVEYITQVFTLSGQSPEQAAESAKTVLRIETALAKAEMDRTLRRDPKNRDHKMKTEEATVLAPNFYLPRYFKDINAPTFSELNVGNPEFFKQVNGVIEGESLDSLKTYATWHLLHSTAPWLSKPFVDANFKLTQALTGQGEIQARWKRCSDATDGALGEALGQKYVDVTFGADGKARMLKMVNALEVSLDQDIQGLSWMSDATKKQAKVKLDAIRNKIGYPDVWRDYSSLKIVRGDLLGNFLRANEFESRRQIAKIGKPLDRNEWGMTPPTVNAYYNPLENNVNFPAGILQPPFYDQKADDAVNFGGVGMVIGHELTHGFDDEGSQFDADGNLKNWWTPKDKEQFDTLEQCFVNEYDSFVVVDDVHIKGKLTLGENTADNGGLRIAHMALLDVLGTTPLKETDGYTPEQRFFISYGQIWCQNQTPQAARLQALSNEHSGPQYRVNGVVANSPDFAKAFGCKEGSPMVRKPACRVW